MERVFSTKSPSMKSVCGFTDIVPMHGGAFTTQWTLEMKTRLGHPDKRSEGLTTHAEAWGQHVSQQI